MRPSPFASLIPVIVLVGLICLAVHFFGANAMNGGSQICMLCATAIAAGISMRFYKMPWKKIEEGIGNAIGKTSTSIIILLLIGMISGTWMISGVVPTLIYYGIQIIRPEFFLISSCVICALMAVMTGSSWTTIATIGIALMGIGDGLGVSSAWAAGAIISGAYFGDKVSPLSDTTVLASSVTGVPLFNHIHYMMYTTIPSFVITLTIFLVAGFVNNNGTPVHIEAYIEGLGRTFNITCWTLLVPVVTGIMIAKKTPALITLLMASVFAVIAALILQPDILRTIAGDGNIVKGVMMTCFGETSLHTGNTNLDSLVSTSGMAGMLNTVWLILCALTFGGVMISTRMIQSITKMIVRWVRNRVSLVSSTVATGIFSNIVTSDQYLSIIIVGSMFKDAYKRLGYESRLLSRTTEDAVTVTSVLIPWNTCGLTQSTVLGVSTLMYLPYCFFNIISPLMSIFIALIGWKIKKEYIISYNRKDTH